MSWISKLFGSGFADPIDAIGEAIDKVSTSDEERLQAQAALDRLRQQPVIRYCQVNHDSDN